MCPLSTNYTHYAKKVDYTNYAHCASNLRHFKISLTLANAERRMAVSSMDVVLEVQKANDSHSERVISEAFLLSLSLLAAPPVRSV